MNIRLAAIAALVVLPPCFAQEPAAAPDAEASPLATALSRLTRTDGMSSWRLTVEREGADGGDPFGGAVVLGGPEAGAPYEGELQVLFDGEELIACTDGELPGFALYRTAKGREIITTTMESGESIDVRGVLGDVAQLLRRDRLVERVSASIQKAEIEKTDNEDGSTELLCELPKSWLATDADGDAFGGMFENPMAPKVLKVTARLEIGADDTLKALRFDVIRSDPMAAIQAAAMSGEFGGGGEIAIGPDDIAAFADEPGPVTSFTLRPAAGAERAKELLARLRKVAKGG